MVHYTRKSYLDFREEILINPLGMGEISLYTKKRWTKHFDFIVLDLITLELSFLIANLIRYRSQTYFNLSMNKYIFYAEFIILLLSFIMTIVFTDPYKNILKNDGPEEFVRIVKQTFMIFIMNIVCLYIMQQGNASSRIVIFITYPIYIVLSMIIRTVRKRHLRKVLSHYGANKAMIVLSDSKHIKDVIDNLATKSYKGYSIMGAFLMDYDGRIKQVGKVPVLGTSDDMIEYASHNWVDSSTLAIQDENIIEHLKEIFEVMGITTHTVVAQAPSSEGEYIQKLGNYIVSSNSYRSIPPARLFIKRCMDILGGFVGCVFTLIITIIIGPMIYIQDPGPIFYASKRVGKNGKIFKMYKFRSMYQDADQRKAELMSQNKIGDGMMFKMDDDPRIIGSEKKDKNGNPKGIGNFIRKTSLDEFPQFFNVLKGDMSLVGTRPPTLDEWEKYSPHHRKRMAIRPGITGMWQASGRSNITDFEEVVRLDTEYIDHWTNGMDIRILAKTFFGVLKHEGAE